MVKTIQQKMVLSAPEGAKITNANLKISDDSKSVEFIVVSELDEEQQPAVVQIENFDELFPIIDPRQLVGHALLKHYPENSNQENLLGNIHDCIKGELSAFRVPCMDPSEEDGKIVFKAGNRPAVGHTPIWWAQTWKNFMPSKNSRSGTDLHWSVFMGYLMKYLIDEKNYSVEAAWNAICKDSRDLGHYMNSKDAKYDFEPTGSRKVGKFCDLANTSKIIENWTGNTIFLAGGTYGDYSDSFPLGEVYTFLDPVNDFDSCVGWLVLDV